MSSMKTTQKARDVMAVEPILVEASTTIRQLARLLSESTISEAPVVNGEGALLGFVAKTDLLRACSGSPEDCPPAYLFELSFEQDGMDVDGSDAIATSLTDGAHLLRRIPVTVTPDMSITRIATLMLNGRIHRILVLEPPHLPAVLVTTLDLLDVVSDSSRPRVSA